MSPALREVSSLLSGHALSGMNEGALIMPYRLYRELRVEAGSQDPGPPPDGYDEHSLVRIGDGEARLVGDDSP